LVFGKIDVLVLLVFDGVVIDGGHKITSIG
jgi:hypothetical protein